MSSLTRVAQRPAGHDDTAHLRQRDGALRLARLGYHIVPEHEVDNHGWCSCTDVDCRKPGKHPRTKNGYKDATRDEATIRAWWQQWPRANIGFDAGASSVAIIGPDAPAWLDELRRRGLPDTVRVQTGSGPGHEHYHYQRTANCPIERVCIPGQFDIMSAGNIIAPGSVTTGPYIALTELRPVAELPPLPGWAVEMLVAEVERKSAQNAPAPRPPSTLTLSDHEILQKARAATNGHLFERLYDGDVTAHDGQDKSASGADLALLSKLAFWCRGDEAQTERLFQTSGLYRPEKWRGSYRANTLRKALSRQSFYEPPQTRPTITDIPTAHPQPSNGSRDMTPAAATAPERQTQSDPTGCVVELERIAELEQALAAERERRIAAEQRNQTMMQTLNNSTWTPAQAIAYLRAQCEYDSKIKDDTPYGEWQDINLTELSKGVPKTDPDTGEPLYDADGTPKLQTSMTKATISKALKVVEETAGAIELRERTDDRGRTRIQMRPTRATPLETMRAHAEIFVQQDRARGKHKPKDPRLAKIEPCPECGPDADVVIKSYTVCADCAAPLGDLPDERITAPFRNETVDTPPSVVAVVPTAIKTKRSTGRAGFWEARERHFADDVPDDAPFQSETVAPSPVSDDNCRRCSCSLPLPVDRQRGFHDYDCAAVPVSIGAD